MTIGDPISQPIPAVGTLGTGYATQVNAFLTEVKARLEAQITLADLLATGALDLAGFPLQNAQYTSFAEQSVLPAGGPVGRYEYYNGEFYAVTPAGVVQITQGGTLAITSSGGIGGDYGGSNPAAVRFDNGATRYDFYDDFGGNIWAYLRGRGFDVANSATGLLRLRLKWAGASSYDMTLPPSLPASNQSVLMLDSTGAVLPNDATNRITNDVVLGTSGTKVRHGSYTIKFGLLKQTLVDPTVAVNQLTYMGVQAAGGVGTSTTFRVLLPTFQNHWRLKSVQLDYDGTEAGTRSVRIYNLTGINTGGAHAQNFPEAAATSSGLVGPLTQTLATPLTGVSSTSVFGVEIVARNGDQCWQLRVVYDTDY